MDRTKKSVIKKLSWTPATNVVHKNFKDLVAIRGHQNYYGNLLSGKITYRFRGIKIHTGETSIFKAKEVVFEKLKSTEGSSTLDIKAARLGIKKHLFSDVWNEFEEFKTTGRKPSTLKAYKKNNSIIYSVFFKNKTIDSIDYSTLIQFKKWYINNFPKRYFNKTYIYLKSVLTYAYNKKYIKEIPDLSILDDIDEITAKNRKRQWMSSSCTYTDSEIKKLLLMAKTLKTDHNKAKAYLGILLGASCGLRKMEGLSLKWADDKNGSSFVSLEKNEILVWSEKNYKHRIVPFNNTVREAFIAQKKYTANSEWVFPMVNLKHHITGQNFDRVWNLCRKKANVQGRYHDLRHTFATRTAELGWPPVVTCEILDQTLAVYQRRYCKPSPESKHSLMQRKIYDLDK